MNDSSYAALLRLPAVARLYVVAFVCRIPAAMVGVVLTLHVVTALDRGYGQAGVVAGASTVGVAIGAPWRGRLVDRFGLRRAIAPSIVVESAVWVLAPHLGYHALVVAAFVAGLFLVPVFSVARQSLSVLVPIARQRTAFALDSVLVELTFMLAPVVGVLLATQVSTTAALTVVGCATVGGGLLLMWANPPTRSSGAPSGSSAAEVAPAHRHRVMSPELVVLLVAAAAASFVLVGTDVSLVASLNDAGRPGDVGWMIALWAGGSVVGGLVHGARTSSPQPLVLAGILGLAVVPAAFAPMPVWLAVAIFVSGLPCAPTLASINATLVRLAPEERRGEVMGWSGTMSTVGTALGAPLCGWVIDRSSSSAGFLTAGLVGGGVALVGLGVQRAVRRTRAQRTAAGVEDAAALGAPLAQATVADAPVAVPEVDALPCETSAGETPVLEEPALDRSGDREISSPGR